MNEAALGIPHESRPRSSSTSCATRRDRPGDIRRRRRHGACDTRDPAPARATRASSTRQRDGRRNTYTRELRGDGRLPARGHRPAHAARVRRWPDRRAAGDLGLSAAPDGSPQPQVDSGALEPKTGDWGFFTNHALLLLAIILDPGATVREMAVSMGVTERAVVAILNQLEDEGIVIRERQGRRNSYTDRLPGRARRSRAGRRAIGSCRRSSSTSPWAGSAPSSSAPAAQ